MFSDLGVRSNDLVFSRDIGVLLILEVTQSPSQSKVALRTRPSESARIEREKLYPTVDPPILNITASAEDPGHFS